MARKKRCERCGEVKRLSAGGPYKGIVCQACSLLLSQDDELERRIRRPEDAPMQQMIRIETENPDVLAQVADVVDHEISALGTDGTGRQHAISVSLVNDEGRATLIWSRTADDIDVADSEVIDLTERLAPYESKPPL
jgi:hypothetical protein